MKTNLLNLSAVAVVALLGQASAAVSSNIVGYVKMNLPKGYTLLSNPLNNTAPSGNTVYSLFGTIDCSILRWKGSSFETTVIDPAVPGAPVEGPDFVLNPGESVFVAVNAPSSVTFVGDALLTQALPYARGNNFLASAIPLAGTATTLKLTPGNGDTVLLWNNSKAAYDSYPYDSEAGYIEGEPNLTVGQGLVLQALASGSWSNTYTVN